MLNRKRVGGRGKKLPYTTEIKRIPTPIISDVNRLIDDYIEQRLNNKKTSDIIAITQDKMRKIMKETAGDRPMYKRAYKQLLINLFGENANINM